jgi:aerobic-type carbon monoxide dehydrogenase small subunit (CoxS/CutS family)
MIDVEFILNGQPVRTSMPETMTLLRFLRDELRLTGAKNGCSSGHCGTCTVIINGKATRSCLVKMSRVQDALIETIEGLAQGDRLHPIQQAFIQSDAVQCGFCTPGMILSARALLDETPEPSEQEIREALSGNLCRCTGYVRIVRAVQKAALAMRISPWNPSEL